MLLWSNEISLEIVNFSNHHIHSNIRESNSDMIWSLIGFYGIPETNKRVDSWKLLFRIQQHIEIRWCVIGDFNKIINKNEKLGGKRRLQKQMKELREVLENYRIIDLG